jgi:hypothetical protein
MYDLVIINYNFGLDLRDPLGLFGELRMQIVGILGNQFLCQGHFLLKFF